MVKQIIKDGIIYSPDGTKVVSFLKDYDFPAGVATIAPGTEVIAQDAFSECKNIRKLILPESVKTIENSAFAKSVIEDINLENVLTFASMALNNSNIVYAKINKDARVGTKCFVNCHNLKKIDFGPSIIPPEMCLYCDNLETVILENIVTEIDYNAFGFCKSLKSFPFKEGLTYIGGCAFSESGVLEANMPSTINTIGCRTFANSDLKNITFDTAGINAITLDSECLSGTKIEKLYIPSNVIEILNDAFAGMPNLTTLEIDANVRALPHQMALGCKNLNKIILSDSISIIGNSCFENTGFTSLTTELKHIQKIGKSAFSNCKNLEFVFIDTACNDIGDGAFSYCSNLKCAVFFNERAGYNLFESSNEDLKIFAPFNNAFSAGKGEVIPPDKKEEIVNDLLDYLPFKEISRVLSTKFYEEDGLIYKDKTKTVLVRTDPFKLTNEINIPSTVKLIKQCAFGNLINPDAVIHVPASVEYCEPNAFKCVAKKIILEEGIKKVDKYAFNETSAYSVILPSTVKFLDKGAFYNSNIPEVNLEHVETYGQFCFANSGICEIASLNENAYFMAEADENESVGTFTECPNLTKVNCNVKGTMPSFFGCESLMEVNIGPNVKRIPDNCFEDCIELKKVRLNEGLEEIGKNAFARTQITKVKLPSTIKLVDAYAFSDCQHLSSFTIPESGNNIKIKSNVLEYANVSSLIVPSSVTDVSKFAFSSMKDLKSVTFNPSITYIPEECFSYCENLEHIKLGDKITEVYNDAFKCTGFKEISSEFSNIKKFCIAAFQGCENLKNIFINKDVSVAKDVFSICKGLENVIILSDNVSEQAFSYCDNFKLLASPVLAEKLLLGKTKNASDCLVPEEKIDKTFLEKVKNISEPAELSKIER